MIALIANTMDDMAAQTTIEDELRPGPEIAVVVPTLNERLNIEELYRRIRNVLGGRRWEMLVVDDESTDGTRDVVRILGHSDHRIRAIRRIGRRGLASATIEGMLATAAPYVAVIDADMQHDERLLPEMLRALESGDYDIVIGSRLADKGRSGYASGDRYRISLVATYLAKRILRADLVDPMSGFFAVKREVIEDVAPRLSGIGFKILLDILASAPNALRCREMNYTFRPRHAGESKLDEMVAWEYLMMLLDKKIGRYIPVRFVHFILVGAVGVVVHMAVLATLFAGNHIDFQLAQALATITAMTSNFFLNNLFTYRDRRLRGRRLLGGWFSFVASCSLGAVANVGIASYLYAGTSTGWVISALAGTLVGAVWNYAVTSVYTWGTARRGTTTAATRRA